MWNGGTSSALAVFAPGLGSPLSPSIKCATMHLPTDTMGQSCTELRSAQLPMLQAYTPNSAVYRNLCLLPMQASGRGGGQATSCPTPASCTWAACRTQ